MKKAYLLALCSVLYLNISCSGSDDGEETNNTPTISGSLSVEEGKTQLEDNTINILDKIDDFRNNDALAEIIELAEYLSDAEAELAAKSNGAKSATLNTVYNIANLKATTDGILVFNAKQAIALVDKEISDDFNEAKGIYTWNSEIKEFEKTGDSEDVIYDITYNGGKNAVFSFTDFSTTLAGVDGDEEIPNVAKANLEIDGLTVFSQDFSASFDEGQLIPTKVENTTSIGDFSFETSYTSSNSTKVSQSFEFSLSNDVIIGYNLTTNGDFSGDLEGEIEDVIDDATINFEFLDADLTISAKDTGFDSADDLTLDEQIALLNSNINAELSVNNKSVAKSEFYKDEDSYTEFIYNSSTNEFDEVEITEDILNARFLFEDGTTNDFDTYFDGSFTSIEEKFDTVFEAYEDLFNGI